MKKFLGLVSILLLLNGCAAIAAIPLPLKIASNIHTAVTIINYTDDNPDNDGWIAANVREVLLRNDTNTECPLQADSGCSNLYLADDYQMIAPDPKRTITTTLRIYLPKKGISCAQHKCLDDLMSANGR